MRELSLEGSAIHVRQRGLDISIGSAYGRIQWLPAPPPGQPPQAQATLLARRINGFQVDQPVEAVAVFSPAKGIHFQSVRLRTPALPVRAVATRELLGDGATGGEFQGELEVVFDRPELRVTIRGKLVGAELGTWLGQVGLDGVRRGRTSRWTRPSSAAGRSNTPSAGWTCATRTWPR